jgi:hypothetical protein
LGCCRAWSRPACGGRARHLSKHRLSAKPSPQDAGHNCGYRQQHSLYRTVDGHASTGQGLGRFWWAGRAGEWWGQRLAAEGGLTSHAARSALRRRCRADETRRAAHLEAHRLRGGRRVAWGVAGLGPRRVLQCGRLALRAAERGRALAKSISAEPSPQGDAKKAMAEIGRNIHVTRHSMETPPPARFPAAYNRRCQKPKNYLKFLTFKRNS